MKENKPKNLPSNPKPAKAFFFSLIAGLLIVINSMLLWVAANWFPNIIPTLPGSTDNSAVPFTTLTAIGLVCGTIVLLGAAVLRGNSSNKAAGIMTLVSSVPTVIVGGGFIVGFILGIMGGAYAFRKTEAQAPKPKTAFIKLADSANKMRIEGAGPKIMAPLFITFAVTAGLSYLYQPTFNFPLVLSEWALVIGLLFLAIGIPFWLTATGMFLRAWSSERLETRGPFAVMPNPIYGSFIVFVIPGISLVLNWWPILLTSVIMYAAHRKYIHQEDNCLREKFGEQYERYRRKVLIKTL